MTACSVVWPWRVWRAFEDEPQRDNRELWRALAEACRDRNGKIDAAEFEHWLDVIVGCNRRGVA